MFTVFDRLVCNCLDTPFYLKAGKKCAPHIRGAVSEDNVGAVKDKTVQVFSSSEKVGLKIVNKQCYGYS
jgi:hypothetical protein